MPKSHCWHYMTVVMPLKDGHDTRLLIVRREDLFVCYDAVTALTGCFCKHALSKESRLCGSARPTRTDVRTNAIDRIMELTDARI
jgi:hypothetical protein